MKDNSYSNALACAIANAAYFHQVYAVFLGSDLRWRAEANPRDTAVAFALVYPDGRIVRSSVETTVTMIARREREEGRLTQLIFWGYSSSNTYLVHSLADGVAIARQAGGLCYVETPLMCVRVQDGVLTREERN